MRSSAGKGPIEVDISIDCSLLEPSQVIKVKRQKHRVIDMTAVLTLTSTSDFIDFRRIPTKVLKGRKTFEITANLTKPSQSIIVIISSVSHINVYILFIMLMVSRRVSLDLLSNEFTNLLFL